MHREFFQNVRERKPSPLRPEVALELSKIAYAAKMSIAEGRNGQGLLVSGRGAGLKTGLKPAPHAPCPD